MSATPWMPLYIADYLADTGHLNAAEHGAYLMLIMHYWRTGGLPQEDRALMRIARMMPDEWADAKPTIAAFFDAEWKHTRIDKEMAKATEKNDKRIDAGRKGGLAKSKKNPSNATVLLEQNPSNALASSSQPQPDISSSLHSEDNILVAEPPASVILDFPKKEQAPKDRKAPTYVPEFNIFWDSLPHLASSSKSDSFKIWKSLSLADRETALDGALAYIKHLESRRKTFPALSEMQAEKFLRGRRWEGFLEEFPDYDTRKNQIQVQK